MIYPSIESSDFLFWNKKHENEITGSDGRGIGATRRRGGHVRTENGLDGIYRINHGNPFFDDPIGPTNDGGAAMAARFRGDALTRAIHV